MADQDKSAIIDLAEEQLGVGTRECATGKVRVRTILEAREAWIDELLASEEIEIERRAVGRLVNEAPPVRRDGDLVIVPVLEEVLVVEKRLRLMEEIVLRRVRREEHHRAPVILRCERAIVERETVTATPGENPIKECPDMTTRTITALFDSMADAERAADQLAAVGINRNAVTIVRQDESAGATGTAEQPKEGGFFASLAQLFMPDEDRYTYSEGIRRGSMLLTASVDDALADEAIRVLDDAGAVDLDTRASEWRASGWRGYEPIVGARAAPSTGFEGNVAYGADTGSVASGTMSGATAGTRSEGRLGADATESERAIPVVEEQLRVGKREVGRGSVRVRSYVVERPVEERVDLREERVTVDRRPVDRPVEPSEAAFQERTIEATETREEAVVDKTARVTEEVVVGKDVDKRTEVVRDTVRKTEVEVDDTTEGGDKRASAAARTNEPIRKSSAWDQWRRPAKAEAFKTRGGERLDYIVNSDEEAAARAPPHLRLSVPSSGRTPAVRAARKYRCDLGRSTFPRFAHERSSQRTLWDGSLGDGARLLPGAAL